MYETLNKFINENYDSISLSIEKVALKLPNEKGKIAEKLHKHFGNSSTSNILKLVKTSELGQ